VHASAPASKVEQYRREIQTVIDELNELLVVHPTAPPASKDADLRT
jgi:hypothetical protein